MFTTIICLIILLGSSCVILSQNPIYSVFFLIFVFCFLVILLLMLQVEFLALVYLVVYVGAVAILFLFVVMMLNLKSQETKQFKFLLVFPFLFIFFGIFYSLYFYLQIFENSNLGLFNDNIINWSHFSDVRVNILYTFWYDLNFELNNLNWFDLFYSTQNQLYTIGIVLYSTPYCLILFLLALIFLIVIVGAISLTLRLLPIHRQNVSYQQKQSVQKRIYLKK